MSCPACAYAQLVSRARIDGGQAWVAGFALGAHPESTDASMLEGWCADHEAQLRTYARATARELLVRPRQMLGM